MNFLLNDKIFKITIILIFAFYAISRILFLDSDFPIWEIAYYQPIDEFYYSMGAFNLFYYNDYDIKLVHFLSEPKYTVNYLTEIFIFLSLKIFGNNYYGLRLASVFAGILVLFLVYQIANQYIDRNKNKRWLILLIPVYMLFDFSFLLSNRIVEPTLYRLLAFMFLFYITIIITAKELNYKKSFLLGFLSLSSVIYVYTTNFFVIPAIGLFILLQTLHKGYKVIFFHLSSYIFGTIISILLFISFYSYCFESNYFQDIYQIHTIVTGRVGNYLGNFVHIFQANIFRFNPSLLFLTLSALPLFIYITIQNKNRIEILLFSFIFLFLIQTIFVNDYYQRKLIFILPLILLMICIVYLNKKTIQEVFKKKRIFNLYITLAFFLTLFFIDRDLGFVSYINYILVCVLFVIIMIDSNRSILLKKYILASIGITFFFSNIALSYKYLYMNPTFKYKNTMLELSNLIDNQYTIGWSHAMRLYNTSIPLMSAYLYTYLEKNNFENHKNQLINEKKVVYEFTLLKENTKQGHEVFKILDINEVTGDRIGIIKHAQ